MRFNHLNLPVPDLDEAVEFLTTHFGMREVGRRKDFLAVLLDEAGFVLAVSKDASPGYPKIFHVGFLQESKEDVETVYQRLTNAGVKVKGTPGPVHGSYGFYFTALGGVMFEVSAYLG